MSNENLKHFQPLHGQQSFLNTKAVCIGSGRFLRAVLVPVLVENGGVAIAQPRGDIFVNSLIESNGFYEVDTVLENGTTLTNVYKVEAAGSLSDKSARDAFMSLPKVLTSLSVIGIGITEAGFNEQNPTINDLTEFLKNIFSEKVTRNISIINTDNIFPNGTKLKHLVQTTFRNLTKDEAIKELFLSWLDSHVIFHNSMVDRITSHRDGNDNVPKAEPLPTKALVIEDLNDKLPKYFKSLSITSSFGVHICHQKGELEKFISLKLLIANATHTLMVYSMALSWFDGTSACVSNPLFLQLIDGIFWRDIYPTFDETKRKLAEQTFKEWVKRLKHPYFEMNTFFISQNATQKLRIRILPTLQSLISNNKEPSSLLAYSVASMLRFLTPNQLASNQSSNIFTGQLSHKQASPSVDSSKSYPKVYANNLQVDLTNGYYQFRNDCDVEIPLKLSQIFNELKKNELSTNNSLISLLANLFELNLDNQEPSVCLWKSWLQKIQCFYVDMYKAEFVESMSHVKLLENVLEKHDCIRSHELNQVVTQIVNETPVIDVHTHLFPQTHGNLILYGIDELLTYHYLIAEYFMIAPTNIQPQEFLRMPKREQANMIWNELFIKRSPLSEACQGVLTNLNELGIGHLVEARNLDAIRTWLEQYSIDEYVEKIFKLANVKYVVMTNIPYVDNEKNVWLNPPNKDVSILTNKYFRSALRIDLFMQNDWNLIAKILLADGYEQSKQGLRDYLEKWIDIMKPEYLMASPPTDFQYPNQLNLLDEVILPIALKHNLSLAMKFGAERGINSCLESAGDGVKVVELTALINLCRNNPKVKFLATFLSRVNQHELCVVANKFRNLHIYGCWWYCNNPSIIGEMTKMRIEILGTGFTAQHSDARVLDQIVYKWKHSRKIIGQVLAEYYASLLSTGWRFTKAEIKRDVWRYFGGAYEEFLNK